MLLKEMSFYLSFTAHNYKRAVKLAGKWLVDGEHVAESEILGRETDVVESVF